MNQPVENAVGQRRITNLFMPMSNRYLLVIALLADMGFDGVDAGPLSESWRQQIGTPVGGTDYGADRLRTVLARADRNTIPQMRDAILQKMFSLPSETTPQQAVQVARDAWTEPQKS